MLGKLTEVEGVEAAVGGAGSSVGLTGAGAGRGGLEGEGARGAC